MWDRIARAVSDATGRPFAVLGRRAVGGGCINAAYVLEGGDVSYFVKTNKAAGLSMFQAEAEGLRALAAARAIRVPEPICTGVAADASYLVLEHLRLAGRCADGGARLGRELAALHRHRSVSFGWTRDNTIGSTPQINTPRADWVEFWRYQRLGFQLDLAQRNGHGRRLGARGERLLVGLDALFQGYTPIPSLLHGDLWSGNHAYAADGVPVLFDPAVYFGDRETDLAMTELFGGFPAGFYAAYREAWPLHGDYGSRRTLYNLYHVLNHLNLFGGAYGAQAERMIDALLAELGG